MPVIRPPARVKPKVSKNDGNISDQVAKSDFEIEAEQAKSSREKRAERAEQAKNQVEVKQAVAEVKQAVNEAQQIADTLKQSKQTANSYTEEVKTVKFKPMVLYIQNHIPKATNYESGEFTTGGYIVWTVCVILGFMLFVMFDKFVQWIKRKLKQCFKRS